MKIAQIQMHVSADKAENIRHACELVRSAGDIDLAVLPEMFCCPYDNACFRDYGEPFAGPAQRAMSQLARERGFHLLRFDAERRLHYMQRIQQLEEALRDRR